MCNASLNDARSGGGAQADAAGDWLAPYHQTASEIDHAERILDPTRRRCPTRSFRRPGGAAGRGFPDVRPHDLEAQGSAPATPASVSLSRADGTVTANWPAVSGATKYHVTYTTDGGGSWHAPVSNHRNITDNSITFNADNGKSYIVGVRAGNDNDQWSGWRNSLSIGPYQPQPTPTPTPEPTPTPAPEPTATPEPQPPAAPTGMTAAAGDGSVTLSWTNPGDATVTGYQYRSRHAGVAWSAWTNVANSDADTTSYTVTGLTNGTEYRFKLRAVNAAGAGKPGPQSSPWYVAATPAAPEPPTPPTSVTVTRADGAITASWPAVSGANGYTVTYSAVGNGNWTTAASNQAGNSITIAGVNNDHTYVVGASASNRAGSSNKRVSPPAGPYSNKAPLAPPSVTILRADGELTAFWNSGYGADDYHVTYSADNGKTWKLAARNHPVGNGTTEITIKNLDNTKQYTVGVRARNKNGYSGWRNSSPSGPYVPIAAPPKPKNPLLYTGNQSAVFIWEKPAWKKPVPPGGVEVTGHQAAYWLNPGVCAWPAEVKWYNIIGSNGDTVYHKVIGHHIENGELKPGLKNDVKYGVALRALNQHVPGPGVAGCLTPHDKADPPPFVPPAPENLNLIRGDGTLTVTWHHARTATGYQVDYSTNGGKTWAMAVWWNNTTSTILRGMDNNTAYTVRVRGRNNRGDGAWSDPVTDTPSVSVSNLGEAKQIDGNIGRLGTTVYRRAAGFTTGSASSGYNLQSVTLKMGNISGSPTGLTAAIHTASSGNPAASATYTLTGPTSPVANAQNTWSCSGVCSLDKDTEYFLVLSATTPSTGDHHYRAELTRSDNQTNTPADAGWSIADVVKHSGNGGTWTDTSTSDTLKFKVTATVK